jgi:flagellar L-ring protein precursor FlgH
MAAALVALGALTASGRSRKGADGDGLSPLDRYLMDAESRADEARLAASPGSLYGGGRLADLVRDQRAWQLDDMVTILVSDRASAIARGVTSTSRKSSANAGIAALAGPLRAGGALANLARLGGDEKVDGQGETSRETQLSTTLAARVIHVLPNGYLVLEGTKDIAVNSERQRVVVRGVCRPQDLGSSNLIRSDRMAQLEVRVDGKGVVGDAVRRPFILYRILNGLLPF